MGFTSACRQLSSYFLHFLSLLIICLGGIMFRFGICISPFVKIIPILYPTMIEIMPLERTWLDLGKHEHKRGWTDKAFCQHFAQVSLTINITLSNIIIIRISHHQHQHHHQHKQATDIPSGEAQVGPVVEVTLSWNKLDEVADEENLYINTVQFFWLHP